MTDRMGRWRDPASVPRVLRWWLFAHVATVIAVAAAMGAMWHPERLRWSLPVVAAIGTIGGTFAGMYAGKCAVWAYLRDQREVPAANRRQAAPEVLPKEAWASQNAVGGEHFHDRRGITGMNDDEYLSRSDGLLYGWTGRARGLVHLVEPEPYNMTALCGVWLKHGFTHGEVMVHEWEARSCPGCVRAATDE